MGVSATRAALRVGRAARDCAAQRLDRGGIGSDLGTFLLSECVGGNGTGQDVVHRHADGTENGRHQADGAEYLVFQRVTEVWFLAAHW